MRIGFVVNSVGTEQASYTTVRLAKAAHHRGHETWLMGVDDFTQHADGTVAAHARSAGGGRKPRSLTDYLRRVQAGDEAEHIGVDDLDVVVMRNDPAEDVLERPWAVTSGVLFGQLSVTRGALVVNDPFGLANAVNKTYFQHFPEAVRPRTMISRDPDDIAAFISDIGGQAVLKPLQGSGGTNVFFVSGDESPNLSQMIEAVGRDGYIVAQELLREADRGDVRLFVMNGEPLRQGDQVAAFRRVSSAGRERRSNMRVGGQAEPVRVTDEMLALVEAVRPKLVADGMFLVGLDIVGDRLVEVNVFSPGGLGTAGRLYGADFTAPVLDALERKVALRDHYPNGVSNARLATL